MIAARLTIRHRQVSLPQLVSEMERLALEQWLCAAELEVLSDLRDARRRETWLAGRLLAKQLIHATLMENGLTNSWRGTGPLSLADICILSRDASQRGIHPLLFLRGRLMPWTLSLSHSDQSVGAVLALTADIRLGIDVTETAGVCQRLAKVWFTEAEWAYLQQTALQQTAGKPQTQDENADLAAQVATIWAAKEAAYKALNEGESFAPRRMEVCRIATNRWHVVWQVGRTERQCHVQTQVSAGSVRALAAVGWTGLAETPN